MTVDTARASAEFVMRSSKLRAFGLIGLGLTGILALAAPVVMIASDAVANPQVIHTLSDNPGSSILLSLGILIGMALLTYPLRAGLAHLGGNAVVRMADGMVTFEGRSWPNRETWRAPLAQFCGVTHHIRATLSGPRHEIVLVHPNRDKDIVLHVAPRHPKEDAVYYSELLGLAQLQPRTLYTRDRSRAVTEQIKPAEVHARAA